MWHDTMLHDHTKISQPKKPFCVATAIRMSFWNVDWAVLNALEVVFVHLLGMPMQQQARLGNHHTPMTLFHLSCCPPQIGGGSAYCNVKSCFLSCTKPA